MQVALVLLAVVGSTAWLAMDAAKRDWSENSFSKNVPTWVAGSLLLWPVVFPMYVFSHRKKAPLKNPPAPKRKPEPQPEPEPEPKPRVEPKPPPKEVAKAEPPKPAAKPPPPKPQPKPQESYDDVLADLRAERGESRPDRVERPTRTASAATPGAGGTAPKPGAPAAGTASVTPEVAAWLRAARLHVRQAWVLPAGLRTEPLETQIEVELDAQGNVLSEPRIVRRSGNPWYDESVVRAVQKASPLPPPPEAGKWPFVFKPEDLG